MTQVSQYFYTNAPIGGLGYHIVGAPDDEGTNSTTLRPLVTQLASYKAPFDLPQVPDENDITQPFPVALRAKQSHDGRSVVARSCYIGLVYLEDGFGSRPGNYFSHALIRNTLEDDIGPMQFAQLVEEAGLWRKGLKPKELGSQNELRLPRISVPDGKPTPLELKQGDEPILAGLINRMMRGDPIFLADTLWMDALRTFVRIESFLTPSIANSLDWSTYEAKLKLSIDIFASHGETNLSCGMPGTFNPEQSLADENALWAAQHLTSLQTREGVTAFWHEITLLGGLSDFENEKDDQQLNNALSLKKRVDISRLTEQNTLTGNSSMSNVLFFDLWTQLSNTAPSSERLNLLNEIYNNVCHEGHIKTLIDLKKLTQLKVEIDLWSGKSLDRTKLEEIAYLLTVEAALLSEEAQRELQTNLRRIEESLPGIHQVLKVRFQQYLEQWQKADNEQQTDLSIMTSLLLVGKHLDVEMNSLWPLLLQPVISKCFQASDHEAEQGLAERIAFIAKKGIPLNEALEMAYDLIPVSCNHLDTSCQSFYRACHIAIKQVTDKNGSNAMSSLLVDLVQQQSLKNMVAEVISLEVQIRLSDRDIGKWLDSVLNQIEVVEPNFSGKFGDLIVTHTAMKLAACDSNASTKWCFDKLRKILDLLKQDKINRIDADRFATQLDNMIGTSGPSRASSNWAMALLEFLEDDTANDIANICPNALCIAIGDQVNEPRLLTAISSATAIARIQEKANSTTYYHALKQLIPILIREPLENGNIDMILNEMRRIWREDVSTAVEKLFSKLAHEHLGDGTTEISMVVRTMAKADTQDPAVRRFLNTLYEIAVLRAAKLSPEALDHLKQQCREHSDFFVLVQTKIDRHPINLAKSVFGMFKRRINN